MYREIDGAIEQRLLDFLGEQPLAADIGQRTVLDRIAGGADDLMISIACFLDALRRRQQPAHHMRLRQRQRAAARADTQTDRGLRHETSRCYAARSFLRRNLISSYGEDCHRDADHKSNVNS